MADALALALANLKTKPVDTPYGIGALTIAQNIPNMIDPYGNPWSNLAIGAGSVLTSALLGYQAREQAREENLEMQPFITSGLSATTAEEIDALLKQPGGERFGDVATQLKIALAARAIEQGEAKNKLKEALSLEMIRQGYMPDEVGGWQPFAGSTTLTGAGTGMPGLTPKAQREIQQQVATDELLKGPQRRQDAVDKERQALTKQGENATLVANMYDSIEQLMSQDSIAADNEIARLGTKIGDVSSVVSPSEAKARINVLPVIQQYKKELAQVLSSGSGLTESARADLLNAFRVYAQASSSSYASQVELAKKRLIANEDIDPTDPDLLSKILPFEVPAKTASEQAIERLAEISRQVKLAEITAQERQNMIAEANSLSAKYGKIWQLTRGARQK
ncbi:MAG: hypothetical protein ACRC9R_07990 [Enterovibrio sp.]